MYFKMGFWKMVHTINHIEKHLQKIDQKEFISHSRMNLKHTHLFNISCDILITIFNLPDLTWGFVGTVTCFSIYLDSI